jgi:hypothetical protein
MKSCITEEVTEILDVMESSNTLFIITNITSFVLLGIVIALLFGMICLTIFKHKVHGFTLWLMIILEIASVLDFVGTCFYFIGHKNLLNEYNNQYDLCSDWTLYLNYYFVFSFCALIGNSCIDVVHWVFSMKYWSLSIKIEMI